MNFEEKKKQIKRDCLLDESINSLFIYKLLERNSLDKTIELLNEDKVNYKCKNIKGEKTATYSKHFIEIFNNFIFILDGDFPVLGPMKFVVLECLFKNYVPKFLLIKNSWDYNDYINIYYSSIKKFVVNGFYKNIRELKDYLDEKLAKIFLDNYDLNNDKQLDELYDLLKSIVWGCSKFSNIHLLFLDFNKSLIDEETNDEKINAKFNFYLRQWEWMLNQYEQKKYYIEEIQKI